MKIGVSSYSFTKYMRSNPETTYTDICDIAKDMGYDGIEFIDIDPKKQGCDSQQEAVEIIHLHCEKIGLPIIAYTVGADFLNHENEVERLKGQIDIAKVLGAPVFRHDICWSRDIAWREMIAKTKEQVREVTEYAARKGIRTCTENHGYVLQDSERVEELIRAVDHPNYGWLVDMGNFLCADENPIHAMPIATPYAVHAHVKDFLRKEEKPSDEWFPTREGRYLRGTVVGHGIVPVKACIEQMKAAGYDGWLSVEFEGMEECLPALKAGLQFMRENT